ncbi:MAG: hypothetical protein HW380_3579 [Magnetococcales bacterium]|nr:hypothetical protein [Magnetococcales bacterium]
MALGSMLHPIPFFQPAAEGGPFRLLHPARFWAQWEPNLTNFSGLKG